MQVVNLLSDLLFAGRVLQQGMTGAPQQEPSSTVTPGEVAQCPAASPVNASWVPDSSIFDQLYEQEITAVEVAYYSS